LIAPSPLLSAEARLRAMADAGVGRKRQQQTLPGEGATQRDPGDCSFRERWPSAARSETSFIDSRANSYIT
jgi:hypothetical protein